MKHVLLFLFAALFFVGCVGTKPISYSPKNEKFSFKVSDDKYYHYNLKTPQFNYTFDSCANESYTIKDASLFLEYISINSNCKWNGSAGGFFEYQMKEKLKLKSLVALDRFDIGHYTFSTLKVNDGYKLQTIYYWTTFTDLFIIDYDGTLTFSLLKELDAHDKLYKSTLPRYIKRYNESLVKWNFFKSYFSADSEVFSK